MKIGFIGLGNMGAAILEAVAKTGPHELLLSDQNQEKLAALADRFQGKISNNQEIASQAQVIFLGLKPHLVGPVLSELEASIAENPTAIWISMAAGVRLDQLAAYLPAEQIVRMMPNTPVAIGQGMTTFATSQAENARLFEDLMAQSGQVKQLPENLMDAATAIAGCGPAFIYELIEAMSAAGIQNGLSAQDAQLLASQTVLGAAQMVLESDQHPAQLRDQVTSPGGSTIAGLVALTQAGFQAATIQGVNQALERTRELGQSSELNKGQDIVKSL